MCSASASLLAAPAVTTEDVVDKIESPWDMAFMKDGTMFFTEKCKGLSVRMPTGTINKLHGVGTTAGYSSSSADLFCDGQAGMRQAGEVHPVIDVMRRWLEGLALGLQP